jgi:hypothetical protein
MLFAQRVCPIDRYITLATVGTTFVWIRGWTLNIIFAYAVENVQLLISSSSHAPTLVKGSRLDHPEQGLRSTIKATAADLRHLSSLNQSTTHPLNEKKQLGQT